MQISYNLHKVNVMFLGNRLKELRIKNNMTQVVLGKLINVTKVSICCYEKNIRMPSLETREDLSNVFGVKCDYFLGKDVASVMEDTSDYAFYISNEELEFLKLLRLNKDLYYKVYSDPKRMIELIDKKLK